ncbi:hypothetical protein B0H98_10880 [Vreelandella songnenensis]|uniref:Uncharacterized protein n=1 Tax=Vreelandella songnenensis TaxID=1176243 RepID=A0A2T0UZX5_9GAMM|nr:hypothetical protein [Halomonas songnenensis]PRY63485.1 hypothetical protein B0H98_10880 [Halomonas songnenensis]
MISLTANRMSALDKAFLLCNQAENFDDFASGVHILLDRAVNSAEQEAHILFESGSVEDGWTSKIIARLDNGFCLKARPATAGGNADIVIEHLSGDFTIICESKILGEIPNSTSKYYNNHLLEGMKQLVTRYSTATVGQDHCILLIFCFAPMMRDAIDKWKQYFFDKSKNGTDDDKKHFKNLGDYNFVSYVGQRGFFTSHTHHSSGYPVKVRHVPVCLYHQPVDKSAKRKT